MIYGKLSNGILSYAPKDYITENQVVIENFNIKEDLLMEFGYKMVIDEKPNYDKESQFLTLKGYIETDKYIECQYDVNDKPKAELTTEEQIRDLKNEIEMLNEAMQELILSVMNLEVK